MTKKHIVVGLLAVVLVVAGVLSGCSGDGTETAEKGQAQQTVDLMEIETSYCKLYYPQKWQQQTHFDVKEDTVVCYGAIEGHDEIALFDVYFGQEQGYLIGNLGDVTVSVKTHNLEFDESWDSEQQFVMYEMQEDINYLIEQLQNLDGFAPEQ